eukprot:CAMPEP_0172691758 /NCGR_PEP_ID=MMETSP1074-20121228/24777_1 /TAXON_ID=2916 /ORGANISM="Ceratium fusus, Strain PA161109" /LENGTH=278 /DNA_ID=CAMNT_0013511861 /DNA_START=139 /DNA_END=975 /DNA_ORIENTATION=-
MVHHDHACTWTFQRRHFSTRVQSAFLGIRGDKDAQLAAKNKNIDTAGIWHILPNTIQNSLQDSSKSRFINWLGHGVSRSKAAILQLLTPDEAEAIIHSMKVDKHHPGVMTAEQTAELYVGRLRTARHLIADRPLARCLFDRIRSCSVADEHCLSSSRPLLSLMAHGLQVVAVNERIRLVTTQEGGEHQKHADISEVSDDGLHISRLTFQCYLNPQSYKGGQFRLYPVDGRAPVDVDVHTGEAILFVQEDPELMHGGAPKGPGAAKCAIRGNLDVPLVS